MIDTDASIRRFSAALSVTDSRDDTFKSASHYAPVQEGKAAVMPHVLSRQNLTAEGHVEAYKTASAVVDILEDGGTVELGNVKLAMRGDDIVMQAEGRKPLVIRVHPADRAAVEASL